MGFKKNIAVPFNFFYKPNVLRSNYLATINNTSWLNYAYLVKNSYTSKFKEIKNQFNLRDVTSFYHKDKELLFAELSDFSFELQRKKYELHRPTGLSNIDIDFSVSTYIYDFDFSYNDLRKRARFY